MGGRAGGRVEALMPASMERPDARTQAACLASSTPATPASSDRTSSTMPPAISRTSLCRLLSTCSIVSAVRLTEKAHSTTTTELSIRVPSTSIPEDAVAACHGPCILHI